MRAELDYEVSDEPANLHGPRWWRLATRPLGHDPTNEPRPILAARGWVALACAIAATLPMAQPAQAQPAAPQLFTLTITVPASVNLGSATPGGTVTAQLGPVTVDDTRVLSSWTTTVSATNFTTGAGAPAQTIANSQVSYWSGPSTAHTGGGTATAGQATAAQKQSLSTPLTAFGLQTGGLAGNSVTWNPTLTISIPTTTLVGTYTGTVTHSVA